jgi:hypothetical protein
MENVRVSLLQRIINKFRYGLVLQVARNQLAKIGIEFTPYYWVQTGISHTEMPEIEGELSDYSVDFLEEADMIEIVKNSNGYTEQEFLDRLKAGRKCLGLRYRGNIVGFLWINFKECDFKPYRIPLENNEAYLADMYTMEAYRGKNLAPYLRCRSYEILRQMGRDKIYSVVEYFNSSARKYMLKTNAKFLKLMLFVKLFNKIKWSFTIKTY